MDSVPGDAQAALVREADQAEVIVVNTCAFIGPAKQESVDAIRGLAEQKKTGSCDKDGTALTARPDDAPDRVRQRLQEYEKKTSLLTDYYKGRGVVRNVSGVGTPDEVERRIVAALK